MATPIPENFPKPAARALAEAGIKTVEEALNRPEKELLSLHGFGLKGLRILKELVK